MSEDINVGGVLEALNGKVDIDFNNAAANIDYVVESYNDGNNWYRVYKSGWIEQGGVNVAKETTVNLLKPYNSKNYVVQVTFNNSSSQNGTYGVNASSKTSTSFKFITSSGSENIMAWYACGQGA